MKKLFSLFVVTVFMLLSYNAFSQVNLLTFNQSSGVYTEIVGDTTVAFALTTTTSGALSMDDDLYATNTLPFSFTFNGTAYTNVVITSNGFVTFGATLPIGTTYSAISGTLGYSGVIAAYSRDLIGNRGITATTTNTSNTLTGVSAAQFVGLEIGRIITGTGIPAGTTVTALNSGAGTVTLSAAATASATITVLVCSGSIVRGTTGAAGSRIHTIQFKGTRPFSSSANSNNSNFQFKLYETTNKFEIVYGANSNSASTTGQVGLRGTSNADFNNRTTTTNWAATTQGATNAVSCTMNGSIVPASGLIFSWSAALVNDVGTTAILSPVNGGASGTVTPSATIKNFGSANQFTPFNIVCTISPGGYSNTISDTLGTGLSRNVSFANASLSAGVAYTVTVYTNLGSDQNRSNDTQRVVATLINENFGNDSGYFYANTLATTEPSFPKYGWKDTTGGRNILVNGVTSPGITLVGSTDDGYFKLGLKTLLLALGQDTNNRRIKYNGVCYDSIFPGTNGIVGLTEQYGAVSISTFTIDGLNVAKNALLPLWHDFNLATLTSQLTNRVSAKVVGDQLIITYDRVASFAPVTDWASFQVVVELVTGCGSANSNFRYTYADTTTNQTSGSFVTNFLASYNATPGSVTTFRNHVVGYSMNGGPIPYSAFCSPANTFAGPNSLYRTRSIFNPATKLGLAVEFGPVQNSLNEHDGVTLTLSLNLEGLYNNPDGARVRDTVQLILRDGFAAPNSIYLKQNIYLDSAFSGGSPFGTKTIDLPNLKKNYPYYFQVKHRNSVSTWSLIDSTNTGTMTYNFTTGIAKAFASNQVIVGTKAAFYTGDITQDGCVDVSDLVQVYNDAANFEGGDYLITDLNWDGIADVSDILLGYNNLSNFICEQAPPGALRPANTKNVTVTDNSPAIILPDYNVMTKEEYLRQQNAVEQGDIKIDSK